MHDRFAREITYARISLTDTCNLRCRYCMPQGECMARLENGLADDEIELLVRTLVKLGIKKIRFTGGEPLVRPGVLALLERICQIPGVEWAITTNATTLQRDAQRLYEAGIRHLNISLDTLDEMRYRELSGGELHAALEGLAAALRVGFDTIRLNTVLIQGVSETQIERLASWTQIHSMDVRFIELMPIGPCREWAQAHYLPAQVVLDTLPSLLPAAQDAHAPAHYYRLPDAQGRIGLITPMSCSFCAECNRIRITADGKLKPCLHANDEIDLRPGLHDPRILEDLLIRGIHGKPERHYLTEQQFISRSMSQIGG